MSACTYVSMDAHTHTLQDYFLPSLWRPLAPLPSPLICWVLVLSVLLPSPPPSRDSSCPGSWCRLFYLSVFEVYPSLQVKRDLESNSWKFSSVSHSLPYSGSCTFSSRGVPRLCKGSCRHGEGLPIRWKAVDLWAEQLRWAQVHSCGSAQLQFRFCLMCFILLYVFCAPYTFKDLK